jgi:hypothetical protein
MSPVSRTLLDMPKSAILHILLWSTRTLRAARSRWIICGHITSVFSKLICNGCLQQQSRLLTILQVIIPCLLLLTFRATLIILNLRASFLSVPRDQKKNDLSAIKQGQSQTNLNFESWVRSFSHLFIMPINKISLQQHFLYMTDTSVNN